MPRVILEVCVDSVQSAIKLVYLSLCDLIISLTCGSAVNAGADRLELCGNLGVGGGTTPSIGLLKSVYKVAPNIPIMVGPAYTLYARLL